MGLAGLRPTDLLAICCWKRLRSCYLILDVPAEDLVSSPSLRKFVQLKDADFMPRLVNQWKADLHQLQLVDVSCRVVVDGNYADIYPLVYGSKCDCGSVHFHVDAESAAAKCLGFRRANELDELEIELD